jgi:hypothetical protein
MLACIEGKEELAAVGVGLVFIGHGKDAAVGEF